MGSPVTVEKVVEKVVEGEVDGYGERLTPIDLDAAFHVVDADTAEGVTGATRRSLASITVTDADIRCSGTVTLKNGTTRPCNKLLARQAGRPWVIECPRCRTVNKSPEGP